MGNVSLKVLEFFCLKTSTNPDICTVCNEISGELSRENVISSHVKVM